MMWSYSTALTTYELENNAHVHEPCVEGPGESKESFTCLLNHYSAG